MLDIEDLVNDYTEKTKELFKKWKKGDLQLVETVLGLLQAT